MHTSWVRQKHKRMLIISQNKHVQYYTFSHTDTQQEGRHADAICLLFALQITHLHWALWVNTAFIYLWSFSLFLSPIFPLSLSGGCGLCIHLLLTVYMCWVLMFVAKGCCALSELKGKASSLAASVLTVLAMLGQIPIDHTLTLVWPKNTFDTFLGLLHQGFSSCFPYQTTFNL